VIARREALRLLSKTKPAQQLLPDVEPATEHHGDAALSRVDVRRAVAGLTEQERHALLLRYWAGRTDPQIAAMLNAPTGTIKIRIHRAHRKLAQQLEETSDG